MAICCVGVICVAWWESGSGMERLVWLLLDALGSCSGKCEEDSNGRRGPPSRESVTCTLVSFVMRERELVRRGRAERVLAVGDVEPMVSCVLCSDSWYWDL